MKIDKEELLLLEHLYEDSKKNPRRTLFISVIFQALLDASKPYVSDESEKIDSQRKQAVAWFFTSIGETCENFEFICEAAGLTASDMRQLAHHVINSEDSPKVRNCIIKLLG